jgi:plasmid stabilization system protein ParE
VGAVRVEWTELAVAQLDEAMGYIASDRPAVALEWLERMLGEAERLSEFTDSGLVAPEAARDDIRDVIVSPYRLIYRRKSDAVFVTMVLHERQDIGPADIAGG